MGWQKKSAFVQIVKAYYDKIECEKMWFYGDSVLTSVFNIFYSHYYISLYKHLTNTTSYQRDHVILSTGTHTHTPKIVTLACFRYSIKCTYNYLHINTVKCQKFTGSSFSNTNICCSSMRVNWMSHFNTRQNEQFECLRLGLVKSQRECFIIFWKATPINLLIPGKNRQITLKIIVSCSITVNTASV